MIPADLHGDKFGECWKSVGMACTCEGLGGCSSSGDSLQSVPAPPPRCNITGGAPGYMWQSQPQPHPARFRPCRFRRHELGKSLGGPSDVQGCAPHTTQGAALGRQRPGETKAPGHRPHRPGSARDPAVNASFRWPGSDFLRLSFLSAHGGPAALDPAMRRVQESDGGLEPVRKEGLLALLALLRGVCWFVDGSVPADLRTPGK